ncbi:hypothetical protein GWL_38030 [Herbaspirillum sp. GW103]|jgi:hypothetical protein|uniref:hypothetical protein n=1 Tax=unclassified Herbaspirillum TaxID=2624150 RepID=UPI00025E417A|nr:MULTISPECIES: hypothetical protein [unclassified Herbaspirillum]EIJ45488.1 hypothetical protein GWL_38030 [Herbaspirillum sp. GW103]MCI1004381.1 hypothetical protein [Herbaspirillum sp. C7C8]
MATEKTFDLLYMHSPITYSIGRHLVENGYLENELLVVCGRNTQWDGPFISVENDGVWSISRTCDYLEKICAVLKGYAAIGLNLYVPHSGFLVGKLFSMAGVVRKVHYIEEGTAAYDPSNVLTPWTSPEIDVGLLTDELERRGILDVLQIDRQRLAGLNAMDSWFFNPRLPGFAGAFCVSDKAFPTLSEVTVLPMSTREIIPANETVWLCLLPCLINFVAEHEKNKPLLDKFLYGLLMMVRMQAALVKNVGGALVIKFHPADDAYFNEGFKNNFYAMGTGYRDFFDMNDFPVGYEPALYNFTKFIVVNDSSALLYVRQFRGEDSVVPVKLD